jgi:hypothetical protein
MANVLLDDHVMGPCDAPRRRQLAALCGMVKIDI